MADVTIINQRDHIIRTIGDCFNLTLLVKPVSEIESRAWLSNPTNLGIVDFAVTSVDTVRIR
jgi:hypothetical protein